MVICKKQAAVQGVAALVRWKAVVGTPLAFYLSVEGLMAVKNKGGIWNETIITKGTNQ